MDMQCCGRIWNFGVAEMRFMMKHTDYVVLGQCEMPVRFFPYSIIKER